MKSLAQFVLAWLAALQTSPAAAEDWPSKPIHMMVGFGAGGGTDVATRIVAEPLGDVLGQRVVVENKPGAGGTIAGDLVAKGTKDGYNALMISTGHTVAAAMIKSQNYDAVKDFAPVGIIANSAIAIVVAQIMKVGMIAEVTCISKPFTVIPMVVTDVQDYIAAGQIRGGEQLVEAQQVTRPGTLLAFLEPLYKGGMDGVTPGSSCIANAYSSNHDTIVAKDTGALRATALHVVDALALVHALILRLQALVLPFQTLVFGGH